MIEVFCRAPDFGQKYCLGSEYQRVLLRGVWNETDSQLSKSADLPGDGVVCENGA